MTSPVALLAPARLAVAQASTVCRYVQSRLHELASITKDDKSPVTIGDLAAQAVVAHTLSSALGPITLVGEEDAAFLSAAANRAHLDAALDAAARAWPAVTADSFLAALDLGRPHHDARPSAFWTLDPIDGTKGFLRGGQYAVCLAFIQNGAPALGILGCPNLPVARNPELPDPLGSTYFALRDGGAFELPGIAPDTPARRLSTERNPAAPIRIARSVEKAHSDASITDRLLAQAGIAADSLRIDSQCKYALLAAARADIYLRVPTSPARRELIWDHAAGALIAAEAGITVSDLAGKPLDFSHGRRLELNTGILAARPDLHPRLLDAVRSLRPSAA